MNVGIFTFPNSTSFGATLQMYALYQSVESLGYKAEVVNYFNAYMKAQQHISKQSQMRLMARKLLHYRQYRKFHSFEKRYMVRYPSAAFTDPAKLPELSKRYRTIICGSDQVWNPDITAGDMSYFLDFCGEETRRVAYAPSFGITDFSENFKNNIHLELMRFHALSVREAPGQKVVEELTGQDVSLVCDPTFLISAEDWYSLECCHPAAKEPYIFYYTIRSSARLWNQCRTFAKEKGLKIVVVGGNRLKQWKEKDKNIIYAVDIGPKEWLYLVHHAQYVVTNSFHGTAFAVNFHKDFYLELSSFTNSRLHQIVDALGLGDRIIGDKDWSNDLIDYVSVEQRLFPLRVSSLEYLKNALK